MSNEFGGVVAARKISDSSFATDRDLKELEDLPYILTIKEYAHFVRSDGQTVRTLCRNGRIPGAFKIPGSHIWRLPRTSLFDAMGINVP